MDNGVARCEMWNAEQRQAKYIINSVRTYEFVGSRWRTLWDYEFMDFFLRVPEELRYGMKLYLDCLRRKIFVDDLAHARRDSSRRARILADAHEHSRTGAGGHRRCKKTIDTIKRQIRLQLLKVGVSRQHVTKLEKFQTSDVRLSGLGITDSPISFEERWIESAALQKLSPEVRRRWSRGSSYKLHSLRFPGVFGTMVLAEMTKSDHADRTRAGR